jgi:CRISPR type III-B/RAMP module RAMP protein Cmr1
MPWTTLNMQVTTPLFNGGADPADEHGLRSADEAGIRVPSIRGAMRFWFRALAGTIAGPDIKLLARMEEAVFGSVASPSPVAIRVRAQPKLTRSYPTPKFIGESSRTGSRRPGQGGGIQQNRDDGKWLIYLLGQGLADAKERTLSRDFIDAGKSVSLALRFSGNESIDTLVLASLWLLCTYGGLGSRVRRGWGGLAITGSEGDLPGGWTPETVRTPGLEFFERQKAIWPADYLELWQTYLCDLPGVDVPTPESAEAWTSRPSYPVLSQRWTRAELWSGQTERDWTRVLGYAGEQFRWFRAQDDTPGVPYRPQIKTHEWKTVTGRTDDNKFALGALGLPIVFKKGGPTVHASQQPPAGAQPIPLRRASPLWLRVVGSGEQWKLFSFAFQYDFLPADVKVHVWPENRRPGHELAVTSEDVDALTNEWLDAVSKRGNFIRGRELR